MTGNPRLSDRSAALAAAKEVARIAACGSGAEDDCLDFIARRAAAWRQIKRERMLPKVGRWSSQPLIF